MYLQFFSVLQLLLIHCNLISCFSTCSCSNFSALLFEPITSSLTISSTITYFHVLSNSQPLISKPLASPTSLSIYSFVYSLVFDCSLSCSYVLISNQTSITNSILSYIVNQLLIDIVNQPLINIMNQPLINIVNQLLNYIMNQPLINIVSWLLNCTMSWLLIDIMNWRVNCTMNWRVNCTMSCRLI